MSLFEIGAASVLTSQQALSLISQNIANANTPYYSRRTLDISEAIYGTLGSGTKISDIRRIFDAVANDNLQKNTSQLAYANSYLESMERLEIYLQNNDNSIANVINESYNALNNLIASPTLSESRNSYLNQLDNLAQQVRTTNTSLDEEQITTNHSIKASLGVINDVTQKIAQINGQIANKTTQERMNLLDQRDRLLNSLAEQIDFNYFEQNNGELNIQLKNGTPLVIGAKYQQLETAPNQLNPKVLDIYSRQNNSKTNVTNTMSGGVVGGLINYQNNAIRPSQSALNRLALAMSQAINNQNQSGIDANGLFGENIFNDINQTDTMQKRAVTHTANQGSGAIGINIDDALELTLSDYNLIFDTDDEYHLVRLDDHQTIATGQITAPTDTITADGFTIKLYDDNFMAGDSFRITPTQSAASDCRLEMTNPKKLALGIPIIAEGAKTNIGDITVSSTTVTDPNNAVFSVDKSLSPPVYLEFTAPDTYQIVNANDDSIIEANITYDANNTEIFPTAGGYDPGYQIQLKGSAEIGDILHIKYNENGAGDNRNAKLLADLYKTAQIQETNTNFTATFNDILTSVASKTYSARATQESQTILHEQASSRREEISGVSLEEEVMNLARFQQAYEANAQILDVVKKTFNTILTLSRS